MLPAGNKNQVIWKKKNRFRYESEFYFRIRVWTFVLTRIYPPGRYNHLKGEQIIWFRYEIRLDVRINSVYVRLGNYSWQVKYNTVCICLFSIYYFFSRCICSRKYDISSVDVCVRITEDELILTGLLRPASKSSSRENSRFCFRRLG